MEVSGKITEDTTQIPQLYCHPCDQDGLKASAHGYCQDCQEHLCKTCFEHHTRPKPCRNHILLDKDAMPMQPITVDINVDPITDTCTKHRDKQLDFYCNNHEVVVCYVCATLEHKQCKVDYIPDVSGSVSDELKQLTTKMDELVKKFESNIRRAETATKHIDESHGKVVEEIKLFRKEINVYLDQMESVMLQEAENLTTTAKLKLKNVQVVCGEIAEEVKRSQSVLNALSKENKHNKLFIEMKNVGSVMTTLEDKGKRTIGDNRADDDIKFVRNEKILEQLKIAKNFGTSLTYEAPSADKKLEVQYEKSYDMTLKSESRCNIVGMAMISDTRMLVADNNNKTIKMINADTGKLVSKITLPSRPNDIINLLDNKFAVAIPSKKCIQMMSYNDSTLYLHHRIDVGEQCKCVAYGQGKLVVGCGSGTRKLVILDTTGNMTQVFDTPGFFDSPEKIVISSDEKFMYVTNYKVVYAGKCTKMDWQGTVVQMYEDQKYVFPTGIQELEDGTLLVCYKNSQCIERLSSSFKKCEVVGLEEAHVYYPYAVTYSEKDHRLFISCSSSMFLNGNDTIKVFNVRWN
ncbi:E3 ubiquitin-protein ligase Midline-1-like [Ruditapes philippinarum]|uniref:E3 ubiquitin-protein ligase Midline-1-like n=1 Tax=Ruditapes philippinarum TaxID=129788 RepID=UPI00295A745C|nr:E3 ubiquitin-protein ligase Midline-1-like [Ruditapes philippinarum]